MSAIELATIPAPIAIANSTKWYAIPPHASIRAWRSSRSRSGERTSWVVVLWSVGSAIQKA